MGSVISICSHEYYVTQLIDWAEWASGSELRSVFYGTTLGVGVQPKDCGFPATGLGWKKIVLLTISELLPAVGKMVSCEDAFQTFVP